MTTLHAYREDGTEVLPGDTIAMAGTCDPFTFRAAIRESNDSRTAGMIAVDGYQDMFAAPFGLVVRAAAEPAHVHDSQQDGPAWESAGTDNPSDIQRDIRGPGGFWALVGPNSDGRWGWSVVDSSDGETVASGNVSDLISAKTDIIAWEEMHGLIPATCQPKPVPSSQPEPGSPSDTLTAAEPAHVHDPVVADNLPAAEQNHPEGYRFCNTCLAPLPGDADEPTTEAAQTTAPPVPGITRNNGYTVYAVLGHKPASPGLLESWIVAAADEHGEHVTWNACASDDGSGRLHYDTGHYHNPGEGAGSEALVDLANRAGVFSALTGLSSGVAARSAFQDSHAKVLDELSNVYGVGRARVRSGLLEAAALGYARVSWHSRGTRRDYGISYDRVSCTFTWQREH